MRDILNQDRAMPLGLAKAVVNIIAIAFTVVSLAIVLLGLSTIFGGNLLPGIVQIIGGPALLFSIYMLLRLLLEILMSSHRANDRLGLVFESLKDNRQSSDETT